MLKSIAASCLLFVTSLAFAQTPTTAPASSDFAQTPMRVQQLRGSENFLYGEADTTRGELGAAIRKISKPLVAARDDGKVQFAGQMIITMTGTPGDRSAPIKLRVGYPVRPGATAPEGFTLGKLESQRAATSVFSGSSQSLTDAFTELYQEIAAAGLEPTGEMRQLFAYYEGAESSNNVFILQVLVK